MDLDCPCPGVDGPVDDEGLRWLATGNCSPENLRHVAKVAASEIVALRAAVARGGAEGA